MVTNALWIVLFQELNKDIFTKTNWTLKLLRVTTQGLELERLFININIV